MARVRDFYSQKNSSLKNKCFFFFFFFRGVKVREDWLVYGDLFYFFFLCVCVWGGGGVKVREDWG